MNDTIPTPPNKNRPFGRFLFWRLLLYLFKGDTLAERWVELNNLDLALDGLLILAAPNHV